MAGRTLIPSTTQLTIFCLPSTEPATDWCLPVLLWIAATHAPAARCPRHLVPANRPLLLPCHRIFRHLCSTDGGGPSQIGSSPIAAGVQLASARELNL